MADPAQVRELPLGLKAWLATGLADRVRGRRVSTWLGSRLLDLDRPYRTRQGLVLRVDPGDPLLQMRMLLGLYDPILEPMIARFARPGTVAIDAGAHIGYVTLLLARAVGGRGRVEAFECDPRVVPRLREHVALNRFEDRVSVHQLAVWNEPGELELQLADLPGLSYVGRGMWEPVGAVRVPAVALDTHLKQRGISPGEISFVKLDVEGAEPEALAGLGRTLAATDAALLIEFQDWALRADPGRRERLLSAVGEHGYEPFAASFGRDGDLELAPGSAPSAGEDVLFLKDSSAPRQEGPVA